MLGFQKKDEGLKIIIVGAGKVGATLVQKLRNEGHDITIVDKNADKVNNLSDSFDIMGVVGNGASYTTQKDAGIDNADLIIAVTESDELNLLCCTIAKQFSNCFSIARVRTPDYSKEVGYLRERLGLARIINPELESAKEMARILYLPTALEVNSFAHGQAEMVKIKIPEGNRIVGKTIAYLGMNITNDILICAVERNGKVTIPSGNFELAAGDLISFVSTRKAGAYFLKEIGFDTKQVKNAMIIGGGRASFYLADQLLKNGINVKILEKSRERCEELTTLLPKAVIINGDGAQQELLLEEGLNSVDAFVSLTGMDEENILISIFASTHNVPTVITKVNRNELGSMASKLGLDRVFSPKEIMSDVLVQYARALENSRGSNVETLYNIMDDTTIATLLSD